MGYYKTFINVENTSRETLSDCFGVWISHAVNVVVVVGEVFSLAVHFLRYLFFCLQTNKRPFAQPPTVPTLSFPRDSRWADRSGQREMGDEEGGVEEV